MKITRFLSILTLFCIYSVFAEFIVPPAPSWHILDEVNLVNTEDHQLLEQKLVSLEAETHHQIGIAIIKSLQGRTIEEAGIAIARTWWIGQKWLDNGLLILVAPTEHEIRIEVGRGLEWVMTDLISHRIIDEYLTPAFKKDEYGPWLLSAVDVMIPLLKGEVVTIPDPPKDVTGIWISFIIFLCWWGAFLGNTFFASSKAWWPGMVIGAILGGLVMWFLLGTIVMAILGWIIASWILWVLDWSFSTGKISVVNSRPGGGRWWGGGFGGGFGWGSGGWFWGGGFGWGGASWGW